jgi:hypothetical protein
MSIANKAMSRNGCACSRHQKSAFKPNRLRAVFITSKIRPKMPEKSPENYSFLTYLWVFVRKVKEGHARAWNFAELFGEIFTAAFAGVITFYLCEWSGFAPLATAAFVGISGHMGSKAIAQLESFFETKFPGKKAE